MQEKNTFIAPMMEEVSFAKIAQLRHIKTNHDLGTTLFEKRITRRNMFHLPNS